VAVAAQKAEMRPSQTISEIPSQTISDHPRPSQTVSDETISDEAASPFAVQKAEMVCVSLCVSVSVCVRLSLSLCARVYDGTQEERNRYEISIPGEELIWSDTVVGLF